MSNLLHNWIAETTPKTPEQAARRRGTLAKVGAAAVGVVMVTFGCNLTAQHLGSAEKGSMDHVADAATLIVEGGRIKEIREKEQQEETVKVDEEFAKTVTDCLKAVMDKVEDLNLKFEAMKKTTSKFEVNNPRDVSQEPTNGGKKRSFEELKKLYESLK